MHPAKEIASPWIPALHNILCRRCYADKYTKNVTPYKSFVKADKYSNYDSIAGNDTEDQIFIFGIDDIKNKGFGFSGDISTRNKARISEPTSFAKRNGLFLQEKSDKAFWLLRTPGHQNTDISFVCNDGSVYSYGEYNDSVGYGIRPVMVVTYYVSPPPAVIPVGSDVNLYDYQSWSYAGTVKSNGEVNEK